MLGAAVPVLVDRSSDSPTSECNTRLSIFRLSLGVAA